MTTSSPPPVLFPAFLYGDRNTVRRKMKAEAKKWAKRYAQTGDFPEPAFAPVSPGTIMIWNRGALDIMIMGDEDTTAHDPEWHKVAMTAGRKAPRWHLYVVDELYYEIPQVLRPDYAGLQRYEEAAEVFICRYSWGAVSAAIMNNLFRTIPVASRRIEAVLSFWEELDTLRYIDHRLRPLTLSQLMVDNYPSEIAMWVDKPTGKIRLDLRTAIDQMRRASEDEIRGRLMKRLRELADTWRDLNHREWLKTPGVIERRLAVIEGQGREWFEDLTSGSLGALGGFLYHLDREYPEGSTSTQDPL